MCIIYIIYCNAFNDLEMKWEEGKKAVVKVKYAHVDLTVSMQVKRELELFEKFEHEKQIKVKMLNALENALQWSRVSFYGF